MAGNIPDQRSAAGGGCERVCLGDDPADRAGGSLVPSLPAEDLGSGPRQQADEASACRAALEVEHFFAATIAERKHLFYSGSDVGGDLVEVQLKIRERGVVEIVEGGISTDGSSQDVENDLGGGRARVVVVRVTEIIWVVPRVIREALTIERFECGQYTLIQSQPRRLDRLQVGGLDGAHRVDSLRGEPRPDAALRVGKGDEGPERLASTEIGPQ